MDARDDRVEALTGAPVFLVGAPRSGTTWIQRILLAHPRVCGGQESHFFAGFGYPMQMFDPLPPDERMVGLSTYWTRENFFSELRAIWRKTMAPVVAGKPAATVLVEKTPTHARFMDRILDLLPESRFIHILRDSRAVVASLLAASRQPWGKRWAPSNVLEASRMWGSHVRAARKIGLELRAAKYLEVRYEDLCADPVPPTLKLFQFVGIKVDEQWVRQDVSVQDFEKQKRTGGSPIPMAVVPGQAKPHCEPAGFFRQGSPDSWKEELSFWQKRKVWKLTAQTMTECGYHQ